MRSALLPCLLLLVACPPASNDDVGDTDTDVADTDGADTDVVHDSGDTGGGDTATDTDGPADPCDALPGRTFSSEAELECGLGPDGVVLCHWSLTLAGDGTFSWQYSDVGESGTWTCEAGVVTGTASRTIAGSYDGQEDVLTWDGVRYH